MNKQRSGLVSAIGQKSAARQIRAAGALILSSLIGLVGCGEKKEEPPAAPPTSQVTAPPSDQVAEGAEEQTISGKLVGVWLGQAYLDEPRLADEIGALEPARQEMIIQRAEFFVSTIMAFQFNANGSLTHEIEISPPGGSPVRDHIRGQWQVLNVEGLRFQLRNTERLADGSVQEVIRDFQLYEDGDRLALQIPLGEVLEDCNPLIVFERQPAGAEQMAERESTRLK